ncbi:hypothetical protein CASFOL_013171 [Castilleja foliolosa]|uniref:Uncharacterized protein n=1 Tax=Castilleja foliolosa TaxID=1961234 RepID=A0ABD3DNB8_9LAMI
MKSLRQRFTYFILSIFHAPMEYYSETTCQNDQNAPPLSKLETLDDDELCIDKYLSSSKTYLQDFHHLDQYQFPIAASSFNPNGDIQSNGLDPFDPIFHIGSSSSTFDFYGFEENGNYSTNSAAAMQSNFHQGGGLFSNFPNRNDSLTDIEKALTTHNHPNPLSNIIPDESSCVTADTNIGFHQENKLIKFNKNQKNIKINNKTESVSTKRSISGKNKSKSSKGQWSVEEDRVLIHLVEKYGERKWSKIAQMLKGRVGKQCRERWHNHLRPDIKKEIWTEDEDRVLIEAHAEVGNKWAEIAKKLPGRTENSIKNHWNATKRRQFSRRKCKTKWPKPSSLLQNYIKSLSLEKEGTNSKSRNGNNIPSPTKTDPGVNIFKNSQENMDFRPADDPMVQDYEFDEVPDFNFHYDDDDQSFDTFMEDTPKGVRLEGDDKLCFDVELPFDVQYEVKKEVMKAW